MEALCSFNSDHPLVLNILEWLFLLSCKGKRVHFCWVPSHVGILGNEYADELAKEGTAKIPVRRGLPFSDFFPYIKAAVRESWQFCWSLEMSNKMREITDTLNPWSYLSCIRRRETSLCRLRIGHTRFSHGFLMSGDYPPFCDDCLVPQTVKHLLIECPSLMELRDTYLSKDKNGIFCLNVILGKDVDEDNLFRFL